MVRSQFENSWKYDPSKAIIFFDIDNMKILNSTLGYSEVDDRIQRVFSNVRKDELIARWYSGDEFVIIAPLKDAMLCAQRIRSLFNEQDISVTGAIVPVFDIPLKNNVKKASDIVQDLKQLQRGTIFDDR